MSLDDTLEALERFLIELRTFDEMLRVSQHEMVRLHDQIDGLWRDEARRTYDAAMSDLRDALDRYAHSHSQQYESFMERKLAELRSYLHGD